MHPQRKRRKDRNNMTAADGNWLRGGCKKQKCGESI